MSSEQPTGKKRRRKRATPPGRIVIFNIVLIAAIAAVVWLCPAFFYQSHFFPGTTFNGANIGNKTYSAALEVVSENISYYTLFITDKNGNTESIDGTDIGLSLPDDGLLAQTLQEQNPFLWFMSIFDERTVQQDFSQVCDTALLEEAIRNLSFFDEDQITASEDAAFSYSEEEKKYIITAEVCGTELIYENVEEKVMAAVASLEMSVTLTENDYVQPEVFSDDADLNTKVEVLNTYAEHTITYTTEGAGVIDADTISEWISIDDEYNVTFDEDAITDFVQSLATKYNTYADEREFVTSLGDTITIGGGDYGWVVDKSGEKAQIMEDLESDETEIEREIVFEQTAFVDSFTDDIGDTYIELDYTNQHMYYYVDGELVLDSDIVSGTMSNDNGSPDGVFKINYKERNAVLEGEGYSSPVDYFMPFAYNVGLHDASWRSTFGGTYYLTSGSRGCINLPDETAAELFELVEIGTPVVAYYRESVTLTNASNGISNAYSYVGDE